MPDHPPHRTVTLAFDDASEEPTLREDLSAVAQTGGDLWVAVDEGTALVRLSRVAPDRWARQTCFRIGDHVSLPDAEDEEIDVEGLAAADGYLWVVGSHAAKRKKPGHAERRGAKERLRRLASVTRTGNRNLLARIPLVPATDGASTALAAEASAEAGGGARRTAARLPGGRKENVLTRALRRDRHLGAFLDIPGKDNGFDVEGLAAGGGRVFLGLRGPVLRGHAVVLAVRPEAEADDGSLALTPHGPKGRPYEKFFLALNGLGIRELCADGEDLLILAGPTMTLDGRARVVRWRGALAARGDAIVAPGCLEPVVELPYGVGQAHELDHPEGLALLDDPDQGRGLLVVYDSPSERRTAGSARVLADFYPID